MIVGCIRSAAYVTFGHLLPVLLFPDVYWARVVTVGLN